MFSTMQRKRYYIYETPEDVKICPCSPNECVASIISNAPRKQAKKRDLPPSDTQVGYYNGVTAYYHKGRYIFATCIDKDGNLMAI